VNITIRKATPADYDALFMLVTQFATSFQPERAAFERCAQRILADEAAWWAVAETAETVIGYCLGFDHEAFYANGRVGWVEELMVQERWRRHGVGRALMAAFEEWAGARGTKLVGLATRRAAPFYGAVGYEASATYFRKVL
jgi:GNAT superfamily N-acetyltransferase